MPNLVVLSREQRVIYARFGRLLARYRKNAGLSQGSVAAAVGLSRTSITNIESGRQPIQLHSLYALASVLSTQPDDLLPALPNIRIPMELESGNIPELNIVQAQWIKSIARIKPVKDTDNEEPRNKHSRKGLAALEIKSSRKGTGSG